VPKIKKRGSTADLDVKTVKGRSIGTNNWDADEYGQIVQTGPTVENIAGEGSKRAVTGGAMRGRKIKGVRDKRDKKGSGNGRRRFGHEN
jgi:hypothetical protein